MFLADLAGEYVIARNGEKPIGRELSAKTRSHLLECVAAFSRWLGRPAFVDDLSAEAMNTFLLDCIAAGRSPYTAKCRRTGLMVLWRFAQRLQLSTVQPGVRSVDCPPLAIDGYDLGRMDALLTFVQKMRGTVRYTGVPRSIYWDSCLRTKWDAGLRAGDMTRIQSEHFDSSGWLWANESKTHKGGWLPIQLSTAQAIVECLSRRPGRDLIWPGYSPRTFCRAFSKIAKESGVNGTTRFVRRGASSELESKHPGEGWKFLRHSCPQLFQRHYRVGKIVDRCSPRPPELGR